MLPTPILLSIIDISPTGSYKILGDCSPIWSVESQVSPPTSMPNPCYSPTVPFLKFPYHQLPTTYDHSFLHGLPAFMLVLPPAILSPQCHFKSQIRSCRSSAPRTSKGFSLCCEALALRGGPQGPGDLSSVSVSDLRASPPHAPATAPFCSSSLLPSQGLCVCYSHQTFCPQTVSS